MSNSAILTVDPVSAATSSQGATLESWSRRVHTISSPGPSWRPIARVIENTFAVVEGPNRKPRGSALSSRPIVACMRSTSSSQASAAAKSRDCWRCCRCVARRRWPRSRSRHLCSGRAVEAGPTLMAAFGDAGKAMAEIDHAPSLWHTTIDHSPVPARRPQPDLVGLRPSRGVDDQIRETVVGGDRERLCIAVPNDLVVDE